MKMKNRRFQILLALLALAGIALVIAGVVFSEKGGADEREALENSELREKQEKELAAFLECGEGVGKTSVRLCLSEDGARVTGAAVVCEGGRNPYVRAEVIRLLSAALGVGANRIYVYGTA